MEHEQYYYMMMEALDGELDAEQETVLGSHLQACSQCAHEWHALAAIDRLFRQAPALAPAADFAQRTLARLPDRRYRVGLISVVYGLLLLSGIVPLILVMMAVTQYGDVISQPSVVRSLMESMGMVMQVMSTAVGAIFKVLGTATLQNPAVLGLLLVMVGVIFVWSGVYRQLLGSPLTFSRMRSINNSL